MARRKPMGSHSDRRNGSGVILDARGRDEPYPPPPADLDEALVYEYHSLWESAVASLWLVDSAPLVVELLELRALCSKLRRSGEIPPGVAMSRIGVLEASLLLTAKARFAAGVEIAGSEFDPDDADDFEVDES